MSNEKAGEKKTDREIADEACAKAGADPTRCIYARTPMGLIAFRPPTQAEHQRYIDQLLDRAKANKSSYQKQYVMACRILPDPERFQQVLEAYPAYVQKLADKLHDAAGDDLEIIAGNC